MNTNHLRLHNAAKTGDEEAIHQALNEGESVNITDQYGDTPLHLAIWKNSEPCIRVLMLAGASSKALDAKGISASDRAKQWGGEKLSKFLETVEEEYIECQQNLRNLALNENWKGFSKALKYASLINIYLREGHTLLQEAAKVGSATVITKLIQMGAKLGMKDRSGRTELHFAAESGSSASISEILNHGADINIKDSNGCTALHLAARSDLCKSLDVLLDCGANINIQDSDGHTALHLAAQSNSLEAVWILIDCGADINIQDLNGRTALHLAAQSNSRRNIDILLRHGADINTQDPDGRTALHLATQSDSWESLDMLFDRGADISVQDKDGHTFFFSSGVNPASPITIGHNFTFQSSCKHTQHYFDGIREICFSYLPPQSKLDQIKLGIERFTGAPIDWWPFCQPNLPCPPDHITLKSMYGQKELYHHLSLEEAERYFQSCKPVPIRRRGDPQSTLPRHQQDVQNSDVGGHREDQSSNDQDNLSPNSFSRVDTIQQDKKLPEKSGLSKEIYWCVDKPWTEIKTTLLCVLPNSQDLQDDTELYEKLKAEYIRTRGHLRHHLFSWKVCTSVKFIKFLRVYPNQDQVQFDRSEIPSGNAEYDVRIPEPEDSHMIMASTRIVKGLRDPKLGQGTVETLQMIPKKNVPPTLQNTTGAEGWGLYAMQGLSFLKILSWWIISLVFGFVFVSLWPTLVSKKDLQNAFVPVTFLSGSFMIGFGICQFFTADLNYNSRNI